MKATTGYTMTAIEQRDYKKWLTGMDGKLKLITSILYDHFQSGREWTAPSTDEDKQAYKRLFSLGCLMKGEFRNTAGDKKYYYTLTDTAFKFLLESGEIVWSVEA